MDPRDLRRFVSRDWERVAASKRAYWADRFRLEGWRSSWNAAQALLMHVRRIDPAFPGTGDRERDLIDHATLRSRLDRAAHAFPGR